jgi:hypothetical protein
LSALDQALSSPYTGFVAVDDATFLQSIPHQVEQGLQVFASLNHPRAPRFGVEY